jgi:hypothetical protein
MKADTLPTKFQQLWRAVVAVEFPSRKLLILHTFRRLCAARLSKAVQCPTDSNRLQRPVFLSASDAARPLLQARIAHTQSLCQSLNLRQISNEHASQQHAVLYRTKHGHPDTFSDHQALALRSEQTVGVIAQHTAAVTGSMAIVAELVIELCRFQVRRYLV